MQHTTKRALVGAATAALVLAGVSQAAAAPTETKVRQADLIRSASSNGSFDFLNEGLHIQNQPGGYAVSHFKVGVPLADATTVDSEWFGTKNQPGTYYEIDADGDGQWDGQLIAEGSVYGNKDAWLNRDTQTPGHDDGYNKTLVDDYFADAAPCDGGTATANSPGAVCGSSGDPKHGELSDWAASLKAKNGKAPVIISGGFSQAGGASGDGSADGVLRSITYGPKAFVFTDTAEATAPQAPAPVTQSPTPAPAPHNVTGDVTRSVKGRVVAFSMRSDKLPAGTSQGALLGWRVEVNGSATAGASLGATTTTGQSFAYNYYCPQTRTCTYVVKKNGVVQRKATTVVRKAS